MLKKLTIFTIFILFSFSALIFAEGEKVTGKHAENSLKCADCHETDTPTKRANQKMCKECHGDMTDDDRVLKFKDEGTIDREHSIHKPHAGQIRCTLCHMSHQPSRLYCNDGCHHNFDIKVP